MAEKVYGIDYGTTYSCIAHIDENGKPVIINNNEGKPTTPSVVYFESADSSIVGDAAKASAKIYPDRTFAFIKREMGRTTVYEAFGKQYKPEELSSMIIRKLVTDASKAIGEEITDVVITCPAYFGINEREATKNAGKLAGLNVRHILNEPTAAAFCYGLASGGDDQVVLVYDLGGGTFDITMIEIQSATIRVIYTSGDHNLGGKDWDDQMVNYLANEFQAQYPEGGDPRDDPESYQALVDDSEKIKHGLSTREKYPATVSHAGQRARLEVTGKKQEEVTRDLLDRTIELTKTALEEGMRRLRKERVKRGQSEDVRVEKILLVGGSSRMPAVARRLEEAVGLKPEMFDPDLAVARGAALVGLKIMAGELIKEEIAAAEGTTVDDVDLDKVSAKVLEEAAGKVADKTSGQLRLGARELVEFAQGKIINVSSKGFGVVAVVDRATRRKEVSYLIHNNTPLPAEMTGEYGTVDDGQRKVHIQVMEQAGEVESPELSNNVQIVDGEILDLPRGLPAGSPITVTFHLKEDGTLDVDAVEPSSGKLLRLTAAVREGVMSVKEVEERKEILFKTTVS